MGMMHLKDVVLPISDQGLPAVSLEGPSYIDEGNSTPVPSPGATPVEHPKGTRLNGASGADWAG